jgi:hypothetical protein
MKRHARTLLAAAALAIVLLTVAATPSPAANGPLLSGRIVNGMWSPGGVGLVDAHCSTVTDCAAWLESGCSPVLAGRDVGLGASIESVRHLADGATWRRFAATSSFRWGKVTVQLWSRDCTEIGGGVSCWRIECEIQVLRIPRNAAWMTVVSSGDNANTTWTLS